MKDNAKIEKMRVAGKILSEVMEDIKKSIAIGVSLLDIDKATELSCKKHGVIAGSKGYEGFPASVCIGVNDVVVHGIPNEYILKDGDMLSVDMVIKYQDVYSDAAFTTWVGDIPDSTKKLLEITKQALYLGIDQAVSGNHIGDIGFAIQKHVEKNGFSVVREMTGHGIGYEMHEPPYIPGYGRKHSGEMLRDGQTIAIEAIINQGKPSIYISAQDGWTSKTKDGMLSALFEHTVVVGKNPEILTQW